MGGGSLFFNIQVSRPRGNASIYTIPPCTRRHRAGPRPRYLGSSGGVTSRACDDDVRRSHTSDKRRAPCRSHSMYRIIVHPFRILIHSSSTLITRHPCSSVSPHSTLVQSPIHGPSAVCISDLDTPTVTDIGSRYPRPAVTPAPRCDSSPAAVEHAEREGTPHSTHVLAIAKSPRASAGAHVGGRAASSSCPRVSMLTPVPFDPDPVCRRQGRV